MELLLIRHAEPVRVAPGEWGERPVDPPLTEAGSTQAERLGAWLAAERVDHVITSPLCRATETAAPLLARTGLDPETDPLLIEYDARADHYIPVEELRLTHDERWAAMIAGRWEEFGGEPPDEFQTRVVARLADVAAAHPGELVAVVCHGGVINVYTADVLGIDRFLWFEPAYTSVTRVKVARNGLRTLTSLNETGHLLGVRS